MRIIANENVSATVIRELRNRGHDVVSVKESMRSAPDQAVLRRAAEENRLVVIHDKDFGALAFDGAAGRVRRDLLRLSAPIRHRQPRIWTSLQATDWAAISALITASHPRPLPGKEIGALMPSSSQEPSTWRSGVRL
jgi:hypothetical protein